MEELQNPCSVPDFGQLRLDQRRNHRDGWRPGTGHGRKLYELRDWTDADWTRARDSIKAQNEKDRTARG
jgi:hypothetical protein